MSDTTGNKRQLPKGWEVKKLGDLIDIQNGYAFNSKLFSAEQDGMPLIRIRDIKNSIKTTVNYIGQFDKKYVVRKGDLLIGMDGEFECHIWKGQDALLNQRVCRLQDFKNLDSKFLFYGINKYLKEIEKVTSYTTVKHISSRQIKGILFPIPPLPEQKRIVSLLDRAFEAIDRAQANARQNLYNAKELFESYLNKIFEEKGEDWEEKRLGEISKINYGYTEKASWEKVGPKFLRITDIQNNKVDWSKVPYCKCNESDLLKYKLEKGDIVFARTGATTGKSYLIENAPSSVFASYLIRLRIKDPTEYDMSFISYFFKTKEYWNIINSGISGSTQGGFNATKLSEITFKYPKSLETQKQIVARLDKLQAEAKKLETVYQKKIANLEELKKSLLERAFSGAL